MNPGTLGTETSAGPLLLDEFERSFVAPLITEVGAATSDAALHARLDELRIAVESGVVMPPLQAMLGAIIERAVASGAIRRGGGAGLVNALTALYRRTPQGRLIAASLDATNSALNTLKGHRLESIRVVERGPAAFSLKIRTTEIELAISLTASGAEVDSIEIAVGS
jgi:hypothetical protein